MIVKSKPKDIGISLKSKDLPKKEFQDLDTGGRVLMELANSPAKFWEEMKLVGLTEADFNSKRKAAKFGKTLINTFFIKWQKEASQSNLQNFGRPINLSRSVFLCISMKKPKNKETRSFKLHTFKIQKPKIKKWKFKSDRCLSGYDPARKKQVLIDWYGLSGGQLKYYPSTKKALISTSQINTIQLKEVTILKLIRRHWPHFRQT